MSIIWLKYTTTIITQYFHNRGTNYANQRIKSILFITRKEKPGRLGFDRKLFNGMECPCLTSNLPTGKRAQPDEAVGNVSKEKCRTMNSKTKQLCDTIRRKVKNPVKGGPMFADNNEILEIAVRSYYEALKKEKYL